MTAISKVCEPIIVGCQLNDKWQQEMVVNELANRGRLSNMVILCQVPYGEGATTIPRT